MSFLLSNMRTGSIISQGLVLFLSVVSYSVPSKLCVIVGGSRGSNFNFVLFLLLSGLKLNAQPLTIATAAVLFHRFFREADMNSYDTYVSI